MSSLARYKFQNYVKEIYYTNGRLSEEAFLRDFAGDLPADKARVFYAVQAPFKRALLADKTAHAFLLGLANRDAASGMSDAVGLREHR